MPTQYTIKPGDTLGALAKTYNTDVAGLQKANPQITNPDVIQAGGILNIPDAPATTSVLDGIGTTPGIASSTPSYATENATRNAERLKEDEEIAKLTRQVSLNNLRAQAGVTAPTAPNLTKTYEDLRAEQGIGGIEGELTSVREAITKARQSITQEFESLSGEGRTISQVATGTGVKADEVNRELDRLGLREQVLVDQLNTRNRTIENIINLTGKDYDNARADYERTYQRALDGINALSDQRQEERTIEQQRVNDAKATLSVYRDALEKGTLSYEKMDPAQKAEMDRLDLIAYGVSGVSKLVKPEEKELDTFTDANGNRIAVFYDPATKAVKNIVLGKAKPETGTTGTDKVLTDTQLVALKAAGLSDQIASDITLAILGGSTLEDIRAALRKDGVDPQVLDTYDRVVNIEGLLSRTAFKSPTKDLDFDSIPSS